MLRAQVDLELQSYLQGKHKAIHNYYMDLLNELFIAAIKKPDQTLKDLLNERRKTASQRRMNAFGKNLLPSQLGLLAFGRQYSTLVDDQVYASNEVLLQGLTVKNNKKSAGDPLYHLNIDPLVIAERELIKRHGHLVAIVANVITQNGKKNRAGIVQAMQEWSVCDKHFNQQLPFVIYDEKTASWIVLSKAAFQEKYLENMLVVLTDNLDPPSFEARFWGRPSLDLAMTPEYLEFLIDVIFSVSVNSHPSAKTCEQDLAEKMIINAKQYFNISSQYMRLSESFTCYPKAGKLSAEIHQSAIIQLMPVELDNDLKQVHQAFMESIRDEKKAVLNEASQFWLKFMSSYEGMQHPLSADHSRYAELKQVCLKAIHLSLLSFKTFKMLETEIIENAIGQALSLTHELFYESFLQRKEKSDFTANPIVTPVQVNSALPINVGNQPSAFVSLIRRASVFHIGSSLPAAPLQNGQNTVNALQSSSVRVASTRVLKEKSDALSEKLLNAIRLKLRNAVLNNMDLLQSHILLHLTINAPGISGSALTLSLRRNPVENLIDLDKLKEEFLTHGTIARGHLLNLPQEPLSFVIGLLSHQVLEANPLTSIENIFLHVVFSRVNPSASFLSCSSSRLSMAAGSNLSPPSFMSPGALAMSATGLPTLYSFPKSPSSALVSSAAAALPAACSNGCPSRLFPLPKAISVPARIQNAAAAVPVPALQIGAPPKRERAKGEPSKEKGSPNGSEKKQKLR